MDEYAIIIFNRLLEHFEKRLDDRKNRNGLYMAKGAFVTYLQGSRRALDDLVRILRWALRMNYLTKSEFRIAQSMARRLKRLIGKSPATVLHKRTGVNAPWQEWPTIKMEKERD